MSGWVFLGSTSTKQGYMCLAQRHSTLTPVRLELGLESSTLPLSHCATVIQARLSKFKGLLNGRKGQLIYEDIE